MASDTPAQRGDCHRSTFKRFSLFGPQPTSFDVVTSHRLGHMFNSISNYAACNPSLPTPCPPSHKRQQAVHTKIWRHFTAACALKLGGFGGAFNQTFHSSKSDDGLISLARELKTYSDRLRRIFPPHSRCIPEDDDPRPPSVSLSDDSSVFPHMAKCEPTLVRAVFAVSLEEAPSTHLPGSNKSIPKLRYKARDTLRNLLLQDPLARGQEYLRRNEGNLYSQTTHSIDPGDPLELLENFSQLLILETTNDP